MNTIRVSVKRENLSQDEFEYAEILSKESPESLRIRLTLSRNSRPIEGILSEHSFWVPFGDLKIASDLVSVRPDEFARVLEKM